MTKSKKRYTKEFKDSIVELYNTGKSQGELSSEYGVLKSTMADWVKKTNPVAINKTVPQSDYETMLMKIARLEDENEIKKTWPYSRRSNQYI